MINQKWTCKKNKKYYKSQYSEDYLYCFFTKKTTTQIYQIFLEKNSNNYLMKKLSKILENISTHKKHYSIFMRR